MYLVTIQNKALLNEIQDKGRYEASMEFAGFPKEYQEFQKLAQIEYCPIFCVEPTRKCNDYGAMGYDDEENSIALLLNVDNKLCYPMEYYTWSDFMYYVQCGTLDQGSKIEDTRVFELIKEELSKPKPISKIDINQVIIPFIDEGQVINTIPISNLGELSMIDWAKIEISKLKQQEKDTFLEEIIFALDTNQISVWQDLNDDSAKCQIGEYWFYFSNIASDECLENFATDELAEMIMSVINNPEQNGIGDSEAEYYKAVLSDISKNKSMLAQIKTMGTKSKKGVAQDTIALKIENEH